MRHLLTRALLALTILGTGAVLRLHAADDAPPPAAAAVTPTALTVGSNFAADLAALTKAPHRLAGTPAGKDAGDYLVQRLQALGIKDVLLQDFSLPQTMVTRCDLELAPAAGSQDAPRVLPLAPLRNNGIIPPVTPPEGLSGTLLLAGHGALEEYGDRSPLGRIVVLDYNAGETWLHAFRLGAAAVIFTSSETPQAWQPLHTDAHVNLPRYFYAGPASDLVEGAKVTIHASLPWQSRTGRNILAFIPGTSPVFGLNREEVLIFAAARDSFGEVPTLSPGARGAANCATLLQLAEYFTAHPPKRHVLLAFFDGEARGHAGTVAFYRALDKDNSNISLNARQESLDAELAFTNGLRDRLQSANPLAQLPPAVEAARQAIAERLKQVAKEQASVVAPKAKEAVAVAAKATAEQTRSQGALATAIRTREAREKQVGDKAAGDPELQQLVKQEDEAKQQVARAQKARDAANKDATQLANDLRGWNDLYEAMPKSAAPASAERLMSTAASLARAQVEARKQELAGKGGSAADLQALDDQLALLAESDPLMTNVERVRSVLSRRFIDQQLEHKYEISHKLALARAALNTTKDDPAATTALKAKIADYKEQNEHWNDLIRWVSRYGGRKSNWFHDMWRPLLRVMNMEPKITSIDAVAELQSRFLLVRDEELAKTNTRLAELATLQAALTTDRRLQTLLGDAQICLHTSLLLGDSSQHWGLAIGGDSDFSSTKDNPGLYGRVQNAFAAAAKDAAAAGQPLTHFLTASVDGSLMPQRVLWGAPYLIHTGEVAGRFGVYDASLVTAQERTPREGTPADTVARLDLTRLQPQVEELARLAGLLGDAPGLSQTCSIKDKREYAQPSFSRGKVLGPALMATSRGSSVANRRVTGGIVQLRFKDPTSRQPYELKRPYAFENFQTLVTDGNGSYYFGPAPDGNQAYFIMRAFAGEFDANGQIFSVMNQATTKTPSDRLNMVRAWGGGVVLPPQFDFSDAKVMTATTNSLLEQDKSFIQTFDGVATWFADEKQVGVKVFGLTSTVALVNGPDKQVPPNAAGAAPAATSDGGAAVTGTGLLGNATHYRRPDSTARAATDLWRLNESRLKLLRSRGVANSSVEELQGRAEDLLIEAAQAPKVLLAQANQTLAFLSQGSVYTLVRSTLDDLVHAVLVLLALSVPFAFALERLLIGATQIYRQIGWFIGFFAATFLLLFVTHPAFAISKTPIIIFLGFAIVVLSSLVIWIIMRKFEVEIKVMQGLESTVHSADVSRFNTIMAAMSMGISTMRRRPLRTALTAVTIILLTFTILCFASFGTRTSVIQLFLSPTTDYSGVCIHRVNWATLGEDLVDVVHGRWPALSGTTCRRYWVTSSATKASSLLLGRTDGSTPVVARGVLGIELSELGARADLARLFNAPPAGTTEPPIWLTTALAGRLNVKAGDLVMLNGIKLRVATPVDAVPLSAARDLDGGDILPVDFQEMSSNQPNAQAAVGASATADDQNWTRLPVDAVVVTTVDVARQLGGALYELNIYTPESRESGEIATALATSLPFPVSGTRTDGVYRHLLGPAVQASGLKDLFFPILLGGLVIFGTMLGSVADREKEIYTFSALGLAPPHVAGLFFAEALVYSVVGGLGGYLLAQGLLKIMGILADFGLVRVPEINYSSFNAIITILVVMATVMISAIYPALKASRSANPGVMRAWKVPSPKGDTFDIVFPFTVSEYDITGVVSFLKEHFDNFSDTGLGVFMARDTRLVRGTGKGLTLESRIALAPFDLGVTQQFALSSSPSEIPGIDEVRIIITRLSGEPKDWRRLNRVLLDDLRRQFLIWRSLPQETMELYRQRTLSVLGTATSAQAAPSAAPADTAAPPSTSPA